jgi:CRISPR-associated exonuclease Cas4
MVSISMPDWDADRLISASEVERWSYCPLSWLLERTDSTEEGRQLSEGSRAHEMMGRELEGIRNTEVESGHSGRITIAYLSFSAVILLMSLALLLLSNIGILEGTVWRIIVVISSVFLLVVSTAVYLTRSFAPGKRPRESIWALLRKMEKSKSASSYFSYLSYIFGLVLLINGIILLRPLGIPDKTIVTVFTISLLVLYGVLFVSLVYFLKTPGKEGEGRDLNLGIPMVIVLLVSLSVLFIMVSSDIDPDGYFGWVFLILSLLWFIGALIYDLVKGRSRFLKKKRNRDKEDLPLATIALMASVFTAMAFLSQGKNLENYNTLSVLIAGLWLGGAILFFIKGSKERRTARTGKVMMKIPESARIVQVDDIGSGKRGKPLVSKRHFLIGSPDLLIEENGEKIPVEIKTGKLPPKPHFSHIMQVSAYLVLVDVNYNQNTPYGYIEYSPADGNRRRHKVEWDMMTKALVLSKVSEIREAGRTGEVHRNHNREGKCRFCSRRKGCPERLA